MCLNRSEIFLKEIEKVIIFIFPCRTLFRLDVEVQVATAKYYFKSKEKYEVLTEKWGIMDPSKNRFTNCKNNKMYMKFIDVMKTYVLWFTELLIH